LIKQDAMPPAISETLLVVVDVQKGFVSEHSAKALPVIRDVMKSWQDAGGISVLTQFVNTPDSPYVNIIGWSKMMEDDPDIEFDPVIADLVSQATAIVRKEKYSSLTAEALALMGQYGLRHVCVIGLDTESCVLATALAAFEQNYVPWVLTDAVASHSGQAEYEAGLLVTGRYIGSGQLMTADEFFTKSARVDSAATGA